jgi:NtrC-family two-component system sensor histidine kinase KinB
MAERLSCYELAMEQMPWGVLLIDAQDKVVAGNAVAAQLLHTDRIPIGHEAADVFPDPPRALYALRSLAELAVADSTPQHVLFEQDRLRAEIHPLSYPVSGYIGAIALLHRQTTIPGPNAARLMPNITSGLKAPMASIAGYCDLVRRGAVKEDQVDRLMGRIDANLSRLRTMLANLMTAVEYDEEAEARPSAAVDVAEAIRAAVERSRAQFEEKGVQLEVDIGTPIPPASVDPRALARILDNLLMSGAQRSPQGARVMLRAQLTEPAQGRKEIAVSISDAGPALAGSLLGAIELDAGRGEAVGLSIARLLAEHQGARAWAESDPRGTHFHLRLPIRRRIG